MTGPSGPMYFGKLFFFIFRSGRISSVYIVSKWVVGCCWSHFLDPVGSLVSTLWVVVVGCCWSHFSKLVNFECVGMLKCVSVLECVRVLEC